MLALTGICTYTYIRMRTQELSDIGFARAAAKFKLLADPTRLKILDLLRRHGEHTVGSVMEHLGCSQPTASRQLSKLFDAHMLKRRRENNCTYYYVADEGIFQLCETMCGRLEREATDDLDLLYKA